MSIYAGVSRRASGRRFVARFDARNNPATAGVGHIIDPTLGDSQLSRVLLLIHSRHAEDWILESVERRSRKDRQVHLDGKCTAAR
jgi:hypothetical protein